MDRRAAARGDGLLDRQPGDLVPEPQPSAVGGEQPARQQLVDGRRRAAGRRLEQPRFHAGAGQRGDLEQLPGVGAQGGRPGQHGVPGRSRHLGHPGPQDLGHVERVSAGQLVQRGGLQVTAAGQLLHRAGGQGGQADPPGGALPGQLAQRDPQLIVRRQVVVAEGDDEQDPGVAEPAAGEPEQVHGRLVGPVDVLHHHHVQRARPADLAQQGAEELIPVRPAVAQIQQLAAQLVGQVVQRSERARGEQAVAGAPGPAGIGQVVLEPFEQRGLADARLPAEDDQAPVAVPGLGRVAGQQGQRRLPLQQFHVYSVGHLCSMCHYGRPSR